MDKFPGEMMNEKVELEQLLAHLRRPECQKRLSPRALLGFLENFPPDKSASISARTLKKLRSAIRKRREAEAQFRAHIQKSENQRLSGRHGKLPFPRVGLTFEECALTPEEIDGVKSLIRKRREAESRGNKGSAS
ncbi:MAG: hypothetical protein Q8Q05_01795 [bacterium]|nr:hypothetical protein [bacterium]